ncbi:MAG TPA: molybdenum cofactor guanylyltransferase MobA, partial [Stellaceae bacterium]|nr:molybdenum cofactor guanylyltransferase MobA [Stellaceae bacterium]
ADALADGSDLAAASSLGRAHPVFGLWPVALRFALRSAVTEEGLRKVDQWTARYRLRLVDFPARPVDPFFNLNYPEELAEAERLAATLEASFARG